MPSGFDNTWAADDVVGPRIVVGVDGSVPSMRALEWAAKEAQMRGAALEVVHADWARHEAMDALAPGMLAGEQSMLDQALARARALAPSILVTGCEYEPPAGQALVEASDGAEMLVVGSRGLSGLKELALGSVSSECAHRAHCPVVIIRPTDRQPGHHGQEGWAGRFVGRHGERHHAR